MSSRAHHARYDENEETPVFLKNGTCVKQSSIAPATGSDGSATDIALSRDPEQRYCFLADDRIVAVARGTGIPIESFGRPGRDAGELHWVHGIAIDSRGDRHAREGDTGKRMQKFVRG